MIKLNYKKTLFIQIVIMLVVMSVCSSLFYLNGTKQTQRLIFGNIKEHMHDIVYVAQRSIDGDKSSTVSSYLIYKQQGISGVQSISILKDRALLFSSSEDINPNNLFLPEKGTPNVDDMLKHRIYVEHFTAKGEDYTIAAVITNDVADQITQNFGRDLFLYTFVILFIITAAQMAIYYLLYYRSFITFFENVKNNRLGETYVISELTDLGRLIRSLITRLNSTKEETAKQKDLFRTMFYNMPIAAYYKDKEGRYLGGNQEFCRLIGKPESFILGKTVYDLLKPDIASELEKKDRALYDTPQRMQIYEEEIYVTTLNSTHNIIYYKSAITGKNGKPEGILAVMMDITEIRRLEAEIVNEKDRLEQMFRRHSAVMILVNPATGKIMDVNDAALNFTGYSRAEIIGKTPDEFGLLTKSDSEANLQNALTTKNYHNDILCRLKNGEQRNLEIYATPITTEDSSVIFIISHDISQKKRQEKLNLLQSVIADAFLLEHENTIFRQIAFAISGTFKCKGSVITYLDVDGNEINPLGTEIEADEITTSIVDNEDVIGHLSLFGKADGFSFYDREDALYIANLISPTLKHWYRNRYHEQNLQNEKKALELIVQQEMENKKKQEQVIFEQKKFADMGQMINAVAHHWRQPLNAMGLMVQSLIEIYEDNELDAAEIEHFEQNAMRLIKYLSETIDNFRYFFAADKEKIMFNAPDELFNLLNLLDIQIKDKKIKIEATCGCEVHTPDCLDFKNFDGCKYQEALVFGFLGEFKQSIINILYNAVDAVQSAASAGSIEKGIIGINVSVDRNNISMVIQDNGGGIPDDIIFKIFDPYFSTKGEGKGTGLGLYMTRLMIENHMNGRITAENVPNGARFTVTLPLFKEI